LPEYRGGHRIESLKEIRRAAAPCIDAVFGNAHGTHDCRLPRKLFADDSPAEVVHIANIGGVSRGGRVLFVGTKKQAREIVRQAAADCGQFYIHERWLGGMLTNFQTIRKQIRRLKELERGQEENAFEFYTKKERLMLDRERQKLDKYLGGVKEMGRLPGAVFVVDAKREAIAVREATRLNIPVIAITDTNADPDPIDFPIPGNDDAIRAITMYCDLMADAVLDGIQEELTSRGVDIGARAEAPIEDLAAVEAAASETAEAASEAAPEPAAEGDDKGA